ncbi:Fic family protein [Streptomyces sp. NPDC088732]|uniref:Fic family protein n=1 Tax=Streptomyces sp. NPDC088732 TaxID=3365879 RepID=UPI003805FCA2
MNPELSPRDLSWDEVDPARHPFDSASANRVVRSLGPARRVPRRPDVPAGDAVLDAWRWNEARPWADAMSHALVKTYGRWVVGWRWAHDEEDFDGGPVGSWRGAAGSITTPEETVARVVASLCEWREWLESLAEKFEAYALEPAAVEDQRILWECAARNLILYVTDRTGCGSAWYGHCRQVLTWFLSHWGVRPGIAGDLVDRAIGGRFLSWTGPDAALVADVAERLALSLWPQDGKWLPEPATPDHLERWLAVREAVSWEAARDGASEGPVSPSRDGAAEDIRVFDGALDPDREKGLLDALALARFDAARSAPLDFALLRGWQQHVLHTPQPPAFRSLPAFAKEGRERYGIGAATPVRLDACLAESAPGGENTLALSARAARAFLDVCFFHPFDDGNARSAFLVLVFVLAREGVGLDNVGLIRRISFRAEEPRDAQQLAEYVGLHIAETRLAAVPSGSRAPA